MFVCASILAEQASASQTDQCDWCYLLAHSDFDDWNDFLGDQTLHPQKCLPVLVLVLVLVVLVLVVMREKLGGLGGGKGQGTGDGTMVVVLMVVVVVAMVVCQRR